MVLIIYFFFKLCKIVIIFLPINLNICFGCSKEPSQWDGSFEYPQHMFCLRNKKINFQIWCLWGEFDYFLHLASKETISLSAALSWSIDHILFICRPDYIESSICVVKDAVKCSFEYLSVVYHTKVQHTRGILCSWNWVVYLQIKNLPTIRIHLLKGLASVYHIK